jgi:hypothetical protein
MGDLDAVLATEGRIVHVRKPGISHCIPAMVVRNFGGSAVNVLLFPDGANDGYEPIVNERHIAGYVLPWLTSVPFEVVPSEWGPTWHWPERS